ncbi:MAG: hypothetical protein Q7R22_000510 [Verrucomicrobiota bacterium JB025]|nr:hypothetical protein [Verrucomicrobiota bacterium JB025]
MSFDQGEFNFDANGDEKGYQRWRDELDRRRREFEVRWGVIIGARVRLQLVNHSKPVEGIISLIETRGKPQGLSARPMFSIHGIEFSHGEIESVMRLDQP